MEIKNLLLYFKIISIFKNDFINIEKEQLIKSLIKMFLALI
jgi:hypothetical protein